MAKFYIEIFVMKQLKKPHTSLPAAIDMWTTHSSFGHMDKKK